MNSYPPKFWTRFLKWFCDIELYEEISGDLDEAFQDRLKAKGPDYARKRYRLDVIKFFKPYAWKKLHIERQQAPLFQNYLKIGVRNILKHRNYSILNGLGLVLGLTCIFLSLLFIRNELRYDEFHADANSIYRIQRVYRSQNYAVMPFQDYWSTTAEDQLNFINELKKSQGFKNVIQFNSTNSPTALPLHYIYKSDGKKLTEDNILWTNSGNEIFKVFDWEFIYGSAENALLKPGSIVLTESAAMKYFGTDWKKKGLTNEYLVLDSTEYSINGVISNVPEYSHVDFDLIVNRSQIPSWGNYTYVKKTSELSEQQLLEAVSAAYFSFRPEAKDDPLEKGLILQPLTSIHLDSNALYELKTPGDPRYLWMFGLIGLIILVITVTNYFNLSIALYVGRQREIGVRKVLGARKQSTISQFLFEIMLFAFLCLPISLLLLQIVLPTFNSVMGVRLTNDVLTEPLLLTTAILFTLIVGFTAGIYPSVILSAKSTIDLFKSQLSNTNHGLGLRRVLVGFQFLLLVGLASSTIFVNQQLHFIQEKDLGYIQEGVISINVGSADIYQKMKNNLSTHPNILEMGSGGMPGNEMFNTLTYKMLRADNNSVNDNGTHLIIDPGTFKALGITHPALRDLEQGKQSVFLVNQTAAEILASSLKKSPQELIGMTFQMEPEFDNEEDGTMGIHYTIDGIVEDYHYFTLKEAVNPMFIEVQAEPRWTYEMVFRLSKDNMFSTIDAIESEYNKWHTIEPIRIEFLEDRLKALYENEQQIATLISGLSGVAIILSLLGLIGLVSFITKTKEREIGVRKVFGAEIYNILLLLNKEFLFLALFATLLAAPLSYWAVVQWLEVFAYRITPNVLSYALIGVLGILIVALTVSLQSYHAAVKSPSESLRSDQ